MKHIFSFIGFLFLGVLFFSCNMSDGTSANEELNTTADVGAYSVDVSERPLDSKGTFLLKYGMIEFESEAMGMKQQMTMYFDNYGEKTLLEAKGSFMGVKSHTKNITFDDMMYELDLINNKGTKHAISDKKPADEIDFTSLTQELMDKLHLKYEGKEDFLGKNCDKFTINNKALKMEGLYLVWKGIPLKTEVKIAGMPVKMTAKVIDFDSAIPESIFEIPENIDFVESLY